MVPVRDQIAAHEFTALQRQNLIREQADKHRLNRTPQRDIGQRLEQHLPAPRLDNVDQEAGANRQHDPTPMIARRRGISLCQSKSW